jgi:hypothetical protein
MLHRLSAHIRQNVVAWLALFVALSGTSAWATHETILSSDIVDGEVQSVDVRDGTLQGQDYGPGSVSGWRILDENVTTLDLANNAVFSEDIRNDTLTGDDVNEASLAGVDADKLDGKDSTDFLAAANVRIRFSGQGSAEFGTPPSGNNGGAGGDAICSGTGCVFAEGGDGGDAGTGGTGGPGGSATCSDPACIALGGVGGQDSGGPDHGEGAVVGLRASCLAGERAVGGGVRASSRDGLTYRSHPATATSTDPSAGDTPTAWYVEAYNQSRVGEGRSGVDVTVRAYVVCAGS